MAIGGDCEDGYVPQPASESVHLRMQSQRRSDTVPEVLIRRELHARGMRFRIERPVPGMPRRSIDIVFPRQQVAVFVDGCFWHACPEHSVPSKHNDAWWDAKLKGNVERDHTTTEHLESLGWQVVRIWEHEGVAEAADRIELLVRGR